MGTLAGGQGPLCCWPWPLLSPRAAYGIFGTFAGMGCSAAGVLALPGSAPGSQPGWEDEDGSTFSGEVGLALAVGPQH